MLYSKRTSGPLPALPLFHPGIFSQVVKRESSSVAKFARGLRGMVLARYRRKVSRTCTANVVRNRFPKSTNPPYGAGQCIFHCASFKIEKYPLRECNLPCKVKIWSSWTLCRTHRLFCSAVSETVARVINRKGLTDTEIGFIDYMRSSVLLV